MARNLLPAVAVAAASLANYDGCAGTLVDTNIWVDCIDEASPWYEWAVEQLQIHGERSPLHVNLIIYTELLVPGPSVQALDAMLDVYETTWSAGRSRSVSSLCRVAARSKAEE